MFAIGWFTACGASPCVIDNMSSLRSWFLQLYATFTTYSKSVSLKQMQITEGMYGTENVKNHCPRTWSSWWLHLC